jgi:hypothetical protein
MPCSGCNHEEEPARDLNPNLDSAELALSRAMIYEVLPQHRQFIPQLIEAVDKMKNTDNIPLILQMSSLRLNARQIFSRINCPYCRKHTLYRVAGNIEVAMLFEQGKVWEAAKKEVWYWFLGTFWMLVAGYVKLIKPKLWRLKKWF